MAHRLRCSKPGERGQIMNVLVVGKGGREHAIVRALALSPSVNTVHVAPGNSGMANVAKLHNVSPSSQVEILQLCREQKIALVIIGPENHLVEGLSDFLRKADIAVFGPDQASAQLEGSKIFAKEFMTRHQVPTATYDIVDSVAAVQAVMTNYTAPYVLKADGLAGGKGVFICKTEQELLDAAQSLFVDKIFGAAGDKAILEKFQPGYELSFFVLTNGKDFKTLPLAQDHKRLFENDEGPNTGGMGAIAPIEISASLRESIVVDIVQPTVQGFHKESMDFCGVVFIGLMVTEQGPIVIEYNVRFGDPETQVLLPLLDGDWGEHFLKIARGEMPQLHWKPSYASCVVLAAEGYPHQPVKGAAISGELSDHDKSYFLHAGTAFTEEQWTTNGGRVLNAMGEGSSLQEALMKSYRLVEQVSWPKMQYRRDIGKQFHQE